MIRIKCRHEGNFVNFYISLDGSKKDHLLMSVNNRVIDTVGFDVFRDAATATMDAFFKEKGITASEWRTIPAPENERSGSA